MVQNTVIVSNLGSLLNTELVDPLGNGRVGKHFIFNTELNLSRGFPKGFLKLTSVSEKRYGMGRDYSRDKTVSIDIVYFVKQGKNYSESGITYKNGEFADRMLEKIKTEVYNHYPQYLDKSVRLFDVGDGGGHSYDSEHRIYFTVLPVTFRHVEAGFSD